MTSLTINGRETTIEAGPDMPLLWVLRDIVGLTGTKFGCGAGLCGACTVHLDGVAVRSCQTTVGDVAGRAITTIEGLDAEGNHILQRSWEAANVPQCGFCQPGQIMQAASLLTTNGTPSDDEIRDAMSGNICRCGCYERIFDSVKAAAAEGTQ